MSDATLLAFGCAVTFIAIAGAYVYMRAGFRSHVEAPAVEARSERGTA